MAILKRVRGAAYLWILAIVAVAAVYVTFSQFVEFSGFAAALAKYAIGSVVYYLFIRVVVNKWINVKDALAQGSNFGLYLLGYAVIAAMCFSTA